MISLTRCRTLVGAQSNLPDDEIQRIRDDLYGLAQITIAEFNSRETDSDQSPILDAELSFELCQNLLPPELRHELEERAAILEFDGAMSRTEAEQKAVELILAEYHPDLFQPNPEQSNE